MTDNGTYQERAPWSDEQVNRLPRDPRDLLSPEERERLRADLIEMARLRRRAEAESQCLPMA